MLVTLTRRNSFIFRRLFFFYQTLICLSIPVIISLLEIEFCGILISLQVRFVSPIYHLNVSPSTGHVCLGFLSEEDWLPTRCIRDVLSAVFSLLIKPEPENSAEQALLQAYNHNRASYEEKDRRSAKSFR